MKYIAHGIAAACLVVAPLAAQAVAVKVQIDGVVDYDGGPWHPQADAWIIVARRV